MSQQPSRDRRVSILHRALGVLLLLALVALGVFRSHLGTRLDSFTVDEPGISSRAFPTSAAATSA